MRYKYISPLSLKAGIGNVLGLNPPSIYVKISPTDFKHMSVITKAVLFANLNG